ncbi:MAG: hypothetical protein V7K32_14090 [Nostoc sp.]|uniref:hypothetical protein n=1 Tax=Nostoc sp. TaxID=1180 RepID=UPI002FF67134
MTHPQYTQQALSRYNLPRLKRIATELGVKPTGDKRAADTWVNAIITHQSTQLQKVDEQALAQAELDSYIADQAQAVAPEPLTIVEISFSDHEYYADDKLVASISYDDNHLTQRWVVIVNEKELFRANTLMRCDRFICIHYKDGTLPVQEALVQGSRGAEGKNLQQLSPLPLCPSAPMPSASTENQIMAHIFNECQNYGFEILNDGIYNNNGVKLGQVGCTDGNWWVKRRYSVQQQYSNSVSDAVLSLSMVDTSLAEPVHEYLQHRPLEQLSSNELQQLFNHEVRSQLQELVTV